MSNKINNLKENKVVKEEKLSKSLDEFFKVNPKQKVLLALITIMLVGYDKIKENLTYLDFNGRISKEINNLSKEKKSLFDYFFNLENYQNTKIGDIVSIIAKLMMDISETEIKKFFSEQENKNYNFFVNDFNRNTSNYTINKLVTNIIINKNTNNVLDCCSGLGNFLLEAYNVNNRLSLYGIELNTFNVNLSKIRLLSQGIDISNIKQGDVLLSLPFMFYEDDKSQYKAFDAIFSEIPFYGRTSEKYLQLVKVPLHPKFASTLDIRITPDWLFVLLIANSLNKKKGKAAVITTSSILAKDTDFKIRKALIKEGKIEAIIQLPKNINIYSSVQTSIIILSNDNKNVKFIDASEIYTKENAYTYFSQSNIEKILDLYESKEDRDNLKIVSLEEIEKENFTLNYKRYSFSKINFGIELNNIVTINRGCQIYSKELDKIKTDDNTGYKLLNLGDIDTHGDIDYLSLKNIDVKDKLKTFEKFILKDGDIVMSAKSTTLKTALIDLKSLKEQIIATGNLLIIRPNKEKINPVCLKVFFDSSIAKKQIELIETGSVMISINLNELGKIRIEIPTKKDQENIAKEYVIKKNIINTTRRNLMKLERDLKEISEKYFQEVK